MFSECDCETIQCLAIVGIGLMFFWNGYIVSTRQYLKESST